MSERPTTLCEAFQRTAAIDPDAVALRTPGDTQTLTWREYAAQVRQVAPPADVFGIMVPLLRPYRLDHQPSRCRVEPRSLLTSP